MSNQDDQEQCREHACRPSWCAASYHEDHITPEYAAVLVRIAADILADQKKPRVFDDKVISQKRLEALERVGKQLRDERRETRRLGALLLEKEGTIVRMKIEAQVLEHELADLRTDVRELQTELHNGDEYRDEDQPC